MKPRGPQTPRRILVVQLRRIGDVLLTTPAVAALKRRFPDAAVDFLVEPEGSEVLEDNPHLREICVYRGRAMAGAAAEIAQVRRRRYDWVIDFMGNPRTAILTALSGAPLRAGPAHVSHRWAYNHPLVQSDATHYGAAEKIRVLRSLGIEADGVPALPRVYWKGLPDRADNIVGLAPASRRETRRWPAESYAALGRMLRARFGCEVVVLWGPGERELAEEVARGVGPGAAASPETRTLRQAAAHLARCRLLVTNCSGPKHLAVALGVPTVTIHGSSDPASWSPPDPRHLVVRRDELFCIGCGLNRCPYGLECLRDLSPERVMDAARRLLESP